MFVFGLLLYHGTLAGMTQGIDDQISSANTGLLCKQLLNSQFALDFAIYRSTYEGGIAVEINLSMLIECNHQWL